MVVPQRLNSYFGASPELRGLALKAQQLAALQRHYLRIAPSQLAQASRVVGLEQQLLTLGADNSAIAAKLRQIAPQLLSQLQENGVEITGILVKVQVSQSPAIQEQTDHALGETSRQQINNLATTMPDTPLKRALQRLLKHSK
jgi:hypothetical protein